MGKVVITPEELAKSAAKYRKEILIMPVFALGEFLKHSSLRTGIRYSETVGELSGDLELGPYDEDRIDDGDVSIKARTLHTFLGSVVKRFSPNSVYQSIYGDRVTKGEALKTVPITREICNFLAKKVGEGLYKHVWDAVRNDSGKGAVDLFNGFDTITKTEVEASNIATGKKNYLELSEKINSTNAVDILKTIWRKADEHLKDNKCKLFVPSYVLDAYNDDYKATTGAIPYNTQFNQTFVEGSNNMCEIVPLSNKRDSDYIHLTTKQNMLVGVNQTGEEEQVSIEKHSAFKLDFVMTAFFGVQFESISPERLFVAKMVKGT